MVMQTKIFLRFKYISIKFISLIYFLNPLSIEAEKVFQEDSNYIDISYLESKKELKDYIFDTGDVINIRFKNKPKEKYLTKEIYDKTNTSYLEPRIGLKNYILDSGDSIFIKFFKTPELSGNYPINNDGEINLPRLKQTYVRGLTTSQLEKLLEESYLEYLINPEIETSIVRFNFVPDGSYPVNEEGEITLPPISTDEKEETRKTFVRGLTSYELTKLLEERYSNYFINAEVFIDIVTFKPLRISISGELRNPGIYNFPAYQRANFLYSQREKNMISNDNNNYFQNTNSKESKSDITTEIELIEENSNNPVKEFSNNTNILNNEVKSPTTLITTLSNAINKAGGLTSYSDISNIEIIRDNPISLGGGKKKAYINFYSYLQNSNPEFDLRLFDGDKIYIPKLKTKDENLVPLSVLRGLSPKFINVSITGQIENPGLVRIPFEGSLSDLIGITGPK